MRIVPERITEYGKNDAGERYSVRLEIPRFEGEEEVFSEANGFYTSLAEAVAEEAKRKGQTVLCELHRGLCEENLCSFFLDFLRYRDGKLLFCRRISDTRGSDGRMLPPPAKLTRKIPPGGGWYLAGQDVVVYENSFTPGREQGVRRSQYSELIPEKRFPVKDFHEGFPMKAFR